MKKILLTLTLAIIATSSFANVCQKITKISEEMNSDFWESTNVKVIAKIPETSPSRDFFDYKILQDLGQGTRCQNAMVKTIFSISSIPGHVFEAIISNRDECDGGNSYGLIKDLADEKVFATVEDSFINCFDTIMRN